MMRNAPTSSRRPAWKRRTLILMGALAVLLMVGVLAASCGGGTTASTTATTPTTVGPATTAGTPTTAGESTTAGVSTTAAAPTTTAGAAAGGAQVILQNIAINPTSVTIKAGGSVTWTNKDGFTHHLVGDNGEFDSGDMAGGATFTFVFKAAGTIAYHCSIHPEMKGTIVVQ